MVVDRLIRKIRRLGAPIVVGIDPQKSHIPKFITDNAESQLRNGFKKIGSPSYFDKSDRAIQVVIANQSYRIYIQNIIDKIYDIVPAVKFQIAFFEQLASDGIQLYIEAVNYAKRKGLIVIGDIKRGDIASTAAAYSAAHIGFDDDPNAGNLRGAVDFATINPYLGKDSVDPFINDCKEYDRGLFVLVKTSNPGSKDIQDITLENGKPLYTHVAELVSEWGGDSVGEYGYSRVGAVVGATHPTEALEIRELMPHTFFLVPGYGAQGGSGKDLKDLWVKDTFGMIVSSSRGITEAYKSDKFKADEKNFANAAREAVLEMKKDLGAYIS